MTRSARLAAVAILFAGAAVSALQPPAAAPAPPQPTFKAQVEYVEVDALVTDRDGKFVRDLTKEFVAFAQLGAGWVLWVLVGLSILVMLLPGLKR